MKNGGSEDVAVDFGSGSGGYLNDLKQTVDSAKSAVDATKTTIETKVNQTKTVVDSVQKAASAIDKVRSDVDALTTFSGAASGSTSPEAPKPSAKSQVILNF